MRGPSRLLFDLRLDVNRADPETLTALPGIGPARAAAWVEARREEPFCSVSAVQRVPGIGPRTLAAIRPQIAVFEPHPASCGALPTEIERLRSEPAGR